MSILSFINKSISALNYITLSIHWSIISLIVRLYLFLFGIEVGKKTVL